MQNFIIQDTDILNTLLKDRTADRNILWATDDYINLGDNYRSDFPITIDAVSNIQPRIFKSKEESKKRTKDKAEVFTPAWICNVQNNLIDNMELGYEGAFNKELEKSWETSTEPILFNNGKTWQDFIASTCLEITCGEAPYLVSRYDSTNGTEIAIKDRIGRLDRKLRVIGENAQTEEEWLTWAVRAYKSIYGYEWQGDSLLIARCNLLYTFIEYYEDRFNKTPSKDLLLEVAEIISWNIWQMDGLKYVIPNSCHEYTDKRVNLFDTEVITKPCPGCENKDPYSHTGIYCNIMNWEENKIERFVDSLQR